MHLHIWVRDMVDQYHREPRRYASRSSAHSALLRRGLRGRARVMVCDGTCEEVPTCASCGQVVHAPADL